MSRRRATATTRAPRGALRETRRREGGAPTTRGPTRVEVEQRAERLVPARRRRRFRLVKIVVGTVLVLSTLYVGGQWVLHQSIFRVHHVVVSGEVHESVAQILATSHLAAHPAMIDVSQGAVSRDLGAYPWIGSVSLIKRWPNTVDLSVHEVAAVAVAFDPHHVLVYVSATGRDLGPAPASANLPTLATTPATLAATTWPYRGPETAAALVASQLPVAFASQVSQVIADSSGNVTLQLTTPLRFFLGPAINLTAKFVAVASAIAHGTFAAGDIVDVTTPSELSVTGPTPS